MAVAKSSPRTLRFTRPKIMRPVRAVRLVNYDPLNQFVAAANIDPDPRSCLYAWVPKDQIMCELFVTVAEGMVAPVYLLSLAAYDPRAGETETIRFARFTGFPGNADAPLWTRRLPPRKLLHFSQPWAFVARLVGGMTDISVKPMFSIGTPANRLLARHCQNAALANIKQGAKCFGKLPPGSSRPEVDTVRPLPGALRCPFQGECLDRPPQGARRVPSSSPVASSRSPTTTRLAIMATPSYVDSVVVFVTNHRADDMAGSLQLRHSTPHRRARARVRRHINATTTDAGPWYCIGTRRTYYWPVRVKREERSKGRARQMCEAIQTPPLLPHAARALAPQAKLFWTARPSRVKSQDSEALRLRPLRSSSTGFESRTLRLDSVTIFPAGVEGEPARAVSAVSEYKAT
ncbi:hypothetical protein B0H14DRAFT_3177705 [Mycena olivaceomarginata]|nr:hypothetical protein B0H14DRAFT_3177705 [Mycena olivaceomarginata]